MYCISSCALKYLNGHTASLSRSVPSLVVEVGVVCIANRFNTLLALDFLEISSLNFHIRLLELKLLRLHSLKTGLD